MQDYATTTGGICTQTDPAGNGTATTIHDNILDCNGSKPSDIVDHRTTPPTTKPSFNPQHLHLHEPRHPRLATASRAPQPGPIMTSTTRCSRRDRAQQRQRRGPSAHINGSVELYYTAAGGMAVWPIHWTRVKPAPMSLNPGQVTETPVPGSPASPTLLLARWVSPDDPMSSAETRCGRSRIPSTTTTSAGATSIRCTPSPTARWTSRSAW